MRSIRRVLRLEYLLLGAVALAVCVFYFWTAYSGVPGSGYYAALTDGFLDGRAYLPTPPPPELLALPDPYDPVQNAPYRLHDASLFEGRWYLYFGPTPVVLLFLPLRLFGVEATDELASALFSFGGFLLALALMRFLIQRYRPQTSLGLRLVGALLLGFANAAPFVLRRPAVYEVAIAAGFCCLSAALYLTLTGALRARPSLARLGGGSLALGLATGARPHLVLALPIFLWAWCSAARKLPRDRSHLLRVAAVATAPLALSLMVLVLYNMTRFGSPTEFGQTYQLGGINTSTLDRFELDRVVPGLFFYFLAPPHLDLVFPFAHLVPRYPGELAPEYAVGVEPVAGVLLTTPLVVLALAAPVVLLGQGRRRGEDAVLASLLLLTGLIVMAVPLLSFDGATMRYEMDWVSFVIIAAILVWLRIEGALSRRRLSLAIVRVVAYASVVVAVLYGLAFSITGYHDGLRTADPEGYARLESAFDWVPALASRVRGEPVVLKVDPPGPSTQSRIRVAAPGRGVVALRASVQANPALPSGCVVGLQVEGSDGVARRVPRRVLRAPGERTLRAGMSGSGVTDIVVRWVLERCPGQPSITGPQLAGFAILGTRVVGWRPA